MPAPPALTKVIVNGVTTAHNAAHAALERRFDLGGVAPVYNVVEWGADSTGAANAAAVINAAYAAAKAAGGGEVYFPKGTYLYSADLTWDSNLVSVIGAGSQAVTLQASGTARINVRPSPFTVVQGPTFRGFTVKGTTTASTTGIYTGDITASTWNDVVVRDFTGTGSVGVHVYNATDWTERNQFGFTLDNNKIGLLVSTNGPADYSFEYNFWAPIRINVWAGQVGIESRGNCFVRGGSLELIGNITDDGILMQIKDTSAWHLAANIMVEQTGGTGGQAILQASTAFGHFIGVVNTATLAHGPLPSDTLAIPNNRLYGGAYYVDPTTGLAHTPIAGSLRSVNGRLPVIAMHSAAGTSPPAGVMGAGSDHNRGDFTVGTGTSTTVGQLCQIAFLDAHTVVPRITLTPMGFPASSAALQPAVFNVTTLGFWVAVAVAPAASQANTTYGFSYHAIG